MRYLYHEQNMSVTYMFVHLCKTVNEIIHLVFAMAHFAKKCHSTPFEESTKLIHIPFICFRGMHLKRIFLGHWPQLVDPFVIMLSGVICQNILVAIYTIPFIFLVLLWLCFSTPMIRFALYSVELSISLTGAEGTLHFL